MSGDPLDVKELHDRMMLFLEQNPSGYWGATYYTMFRTMQPRFIEHSDREEQNRLNKNFDVSSEYGSKWWSPGDLELDETDGTLNVSGDSAWGPVLALCEKLATEYNLEITCEFAEPGMDFAGEYTYDASGCIMEEDYTNAEYEYKDDKESFIHNTIDYGVDCFDNIEEFMEAYKDTFKIIQEKYEDTETTQKIEKGVKKRMEKSKQEGAT
jgi:hypothetical protein